ncbi:MAG: hypothetical protein JW934_00505 [Anaerolineae bacterium]|nr:hypothetical protein [Anaerolineae bacterium]
MTAYLIDTNHACALMNNVQLPGTDVQIAAVARLRDLVVLSSDRHFGYVDNLQVENWL